VSKDPIGASGIFQIKVRFMNSSSQAVILLPEKDPADGDGESSFSDEEELKSRAGSPSHFNVAKKHRKKHDRKKKQL
jgi:hypothetical protein